MGTALGDWSADTIGLGYSGGIALFSSLILLMVLLYKFTS
ncbi:PF03988 repeat protein, partial [Acinetobacter baumannii OIFC087]